MKETIRAKLSKLSARLEEVNILLSTEDATKDIEKYRQLSKEHAEISPISLAYKSFLEGEKNIEGAKELLDDPDLKELAEDDLKKNLEDLDRLEADLYRMLLPKDPNDNKNVYLEIRAGTGGDESSLFAGDLFRMYLRYAERQRWNVEVIAESITGLGGYKEIVVKLSGKNVYSRLKFESGGHRVQRIPATETQGRVHTSACTVAILPEANEIDEVELSHDELRIDTYRASGAGGQHVNKTDSAVRITHLPTGIVVECQDDRSQHKNKAQAMSVLAARIKNQKISAQQAEEAATRKLLIGSGDRSERIRTYNFPQGRLTDHRINLTLYKLQSAIDGELDELLDALTTEYQTEQLTDIMSSQ